ncbi:long-chain-fatty-acid--CoA ligase [Allonocardiopsis opalescens]|uniref:Long-chain acyl-CoA synthetase n=1 Tax=Allonocardiopsis opalescens TaxID=1144618 RepID=A0A2T0Q136_9ACTN|nr:long-chain fatty acid--CoA ligase [Allonocardiopsis opalescens]PRX97393.1 long-chain acyl-CoA synthetase [Allonocardiopsis opalescens]
MLNLSVVLEDSARTAPGRTAIVCGDARLSYAEVEAAARRMAGLLRARGLVPGDKVALVCPNLPLFPIAYFGILKAGCVVVPLNPLLKRDELAYHLADSDARMLCCFGGAPGVETGAEGRAAFDATPGCTEFLVITPRPDDPSPVPGTETLWAALAGADPADTAPTRADDTAVILYTSGTTGRPKGAELTHANMVQNSQLGARMFTLHDDDVHLVALPLFHVFAESTHLTSGFGRQATLVLLPRFDAGQMMGAIRAERATVIAGVPTMFWAMLNHPDAALGLGDSVRVAISGGSGIPAELHAAFRERFGIHLHEGYGMSETSPTTISNSEKIPYRPGSIGKPVWGIEARLIDPDWNEITGEGPGELAVRGHAVMKGYYKRPEATAEVMRDGWLRTGDIARRDADGYYYIVDRAKEMIIRNGLNVYPREVEEVLMTHPGISLVAVVGVPDERHGEEIKAIAVRAPGAELTEQELVDWAAARMAAYKYPRTVEFRDTLPLTATGKILKRELR